ncbi:MAG: ATP synthase F1 subunit gamma [Spirochaetia bacterium]|jgi:F-type H+-transporting ATPase subunit gamma
MAKTRDIRKRIASVRNIHKITRTMEKVAQSKGMKLTGRFDNAKAFRHDVAVLLPEALGAPLESIEAAQELASHPLGALRPDVKQVLLFCVTSSRGLCGGYNAKVIQAARARMDALRKEGKAPHLAVMGRKGLAYFRYHNQAVTISIADADENIPYGRLDEVVEEMCRRFVAKEFDEVQIVATRFRSRAVQEVGIAPFLPFVPATARAVIGAGRAAPTEGPGGEPLYLVEPDRRRLLAQLLPLIVKTELFCVILEAMLCEQAQRSLAMRSASDNADSMTKRLTRTYNRVRQAQITNEMIEIIGGSEGGRT